MKKYLFVALAALGFAACAEKMDDTNAPVQNGEIEESFISINLMSADLDTRSNGDPAGGYEDGTDDERKITSAHFFFFRDNVPFNVTADGTGQVGETNHLILTGLEASKENALENISDVTNAVLVLKNYKGQYPNQIVAVLNWTPDDKTYTLTDLHNEIYANSLRNEKGDFVMSNAVYMDGTNKIIDVAPISTDNIKTTAADAENSPVDIYVERVAAKVVLNAAGKVNGTDNIYNVQKPIDYLSTLGAHSKDVYVKIVGWELYNDYQESNLLKNINPSWDVSTLGLTWNDIPYFRSYWAISQSTAMNDTFAWEYTEKPESYETNHGFKVGSAAYCAENTNQVSGTTDPRTKVILKGQLMKEKSEGDYEALPLARWYGKYFIGEEDLLTAVANTMTYTIFYEESTGVYKNITPEDLECVNIVGVGEAYEVCFQLSTQGLMRKWYQYSSENGYVSFGDHDSNANNPNSVAINAYLDNIQPALYYKSGQTYYYIDIEHLGTAAAKYGVVRNHVYQINVNSIKGYGTPVFIPNSNIVTPEYPELEQESYVAARINVLSWKIVHQGVDIEQ
ncbi:MAG: Mfa1 fimbrilin C-terminal domain-containing protein [Bacteroidales bacterium]|nr:Mfa1 fimbrilin C-terminal domain-containing protein [Bacteroidales bacterium]